MTKGKKPGKKTGDDKVVKIQDKQREKENQKVQESFNGTITKIKIKKDIPEISYKFEGQSSKKEMKIKGIEKPEDEFLAAMQSLKDFFVEITELEEHREDITIFCVSFSKNGVVVSGQYELKKNDLNVPLPINSPHIPFKSNGGYEVPEDVKEQFKELSACVVRYIERETTDRQTKLPLAEVK